LEIGQAALALVRDIDMEVTTVSTARMLALAERAFGAAHEVLAMRGQFILDILDVIYS
jgi:hypothetical protein